MPSTRREFLQISLAGAGCLAGLASSCTNRPARGALRTVQTVLGPIRENQLGVTLPHEHVLVDFIGAAKVSRDRYRADDVFKAALPHLQRIRDLGCQTLAECTSAYIGRDPALLKRLAVAAGLNVLTNTGYYGASKNKFLPEHAFTDSADQLAERWIREAKEGIEGTGIRPGFMKIGVDAGPLSEVHRKLVHAAARAHWATGLTIAAHTGNGVAALEELAVLDREGLKGEAFIWVHAQSESDAKLHARAAERGVWVEFDGIGPNSIDQHLKLVLAMRARGFLNRVLLSHDAGWYHVGEPGGGNFRPFDALFTTFVPALKNAGCSETELRQLLVLNPREVFVIRVRGR
ncbi:MAG: phosphotriesterase [Verrucomicrobia bacterium]|nr:phosphotriesterase [Verrucomicrobiota bacterium]